jgi:hypothetical protein
MGKDIFISHAWGYDSFNRDNHLRCKKLADFLILNGYSVWFDTYDMVGNIDNSIMNGINNADVILICLTEKYFTKINNAVNTNKVNDNCYKEWNYSMFKQKKIIPLIMDNKSIDLFLNKDGIIQMYLSSSMFINFSNNFTDEIEILLKTLKKYNIFNREEKKFYNIKTNSSFDNLVNLFNDKLKTISPKRHIFNLQKSNSFYLQSLANEFLNTSYSQKKFKKNFILTSKNISKLKKIVFI